MRFELPDRSAVVTGAAGGIGSSIVNGLLRAGATVTGLDIADMSSVSADQASEAHFRPVTCDVTDPEAVVAAVPESIDVLVAAAGAFPNRPLESWDATEFRALWELNVVGVFNAVQACLSALRRSGDGRIVLISSQAVFQGVPGFVPYTATKGALIGMARSLAAELGPDGIRVNVVTPGLTETAAALDGDVAAFFDQVVALQDVPRRQQPADVTAAVLFLCDEATDFITGQIINVDGGATKR